jgi:leucyl aminopeptidase
MTVELKKPTARCIPVHATDRASFSAHASRLAASARKWLTTTGFTGAPDTFALLPDVAGEARGG